MTSLFSTGPGFQRSERSDVRITIYRRGCELLSIPSGALPMSGQSEQDSQPSVVSCQVQMAIGQPGSFQMSLKLPANQDILKMCMDDDWVDIEMGRDGKWWHVMRGLVDEVRCATTVGGAGSTSRSILIAGQSFQKVWTQTPMWFSSIYSEQLGVPGQALSSKNSSILGIGLGVPDTISSFLFTYASRVAQAQRSSIALPSSMPNTSGDFMDTWRQDQTGFDDSDAPRINILASMYAPSQTVWDVAMGWSDPYFVEVFTALLPKVPVRPTSRPPLGDTRTQMVNATSAMAALGPNYEAVQEGLPISATAMTLVIRNKPFINVDPENSAELGFASPWFTLPTLRLAAQDVVTLDCGRNGYERANAFFSSAQLLSATGEAPIDAKALPTWSVPEMQQWGMRTLDAVSNYIPKLSAVSPGLTATSLALRLRARLRDHHMFDAYALNGSLTLGRAAPEAQVGTRILYQDGQNRLTAYCEVVSHAYAPSSGWRTNLGFTRGYSTSDARHLADLKKLRAQYTQPLY